MQQPPSNQAYFANAQDQQYQQQQQPQPQQYQQQYQPQQYQYQQPQPQQQYPSYQQQQYDAQQYRYQQQQQYAQYDQYQQSQPQYPPQTSYPYMNGSTQPNANTNAPYSNQTAFDSPSTLPSGLPPRPPTSLNTNSDAYAGGFSGASPSLSSSSLPQSLSNDSMNGPLPAPKRSPSSSKLDPTATTPKHRIDPKQIPRAEVEKAGNPLVEFMTRSGSTPPTSLSTFKVVDEGNCSPRFIRLTTYQIAANEQLTDQTKLVVGAILQPLADLGTGEVGFVALYNPQTSLNILIHPFKHPPIQVTGSSGFSLLAPILN